LTARLTNCGCCLHCPSLRAPDAGKPVSLVRECEADWSAICDVSSKEDAFQRGARRRRIVGKEDHEGFAGRDAERICQRRRASVIADEEVERLLNETARLFERKMCKRLRPRAVCPRLERVGVYIPPIS
jgi:hypothetical protein